MLALRATIDPLPGNWVIRSVDFSAALLPTTERIDGPHIEADFAIENRSQDFNIVFDVYLAEDGSAEPHKLPFGESVKAIVPVTLEP